MLQPSVSFLKILWCILSLRESWTPRFLTEMLLKPYPVEIYLQSGLTYDTGERAIFMSQIEVQDVLLDLDIALFRTMILRKFQRVLVSELENIPLISLVKTPELEEQLVELARKVVSRFWCKTIRSFSSILAVNHEMVLSSPMGMFNWRASSCSQ